jgi:hypothetical protein
VTTSTTTTTTTIATTTTTLTPRTVSTPATVPAGSAPVATALPVASVPGLAVGDSVLEDVQLYAPTTLSSHAISVNAAVSRAWVAGEGIFGSLRASGRLPAIVIVALGTNGPVRAADFDTMMQAVAGATRVVFMTVTGPEIANNDVIRAGVARYPQAALADWASLAAAHPAWFARDGVHIGPAGATALGNLLAGAAA